MSVTISGNGTITVTNASGTTTIDSTTVKTQNIKHPSPTPNNIALSSNGDATLERGLNKEWYGFYAFPMLMMVFPIMHKKELSVIEHF